MYVISWLLRLTAFMYGFNMSAMFIAGSIKGQTYPALAVIFGGLIALCFVLAFKPRWIFPKLDMWLAEANAYLAACNPWKK